MKLLWVLLVIRCASLSHTQGIAAGVCDDWLLVSSCNPCVHSTIQPSGSVVTTLGGDARFQCIPTTSQDNVQWLMNSSAALLNRNIELGNAVFTRVQYDFVYWFLDLVNLTSNYNHTEIQCSTPATGITSSPALLLLQGYVTYLHIRGACMSEMSITMVINEHILIMRINIPNILHDLRLKNYF